MMQKKSLLQGFVVVLFLILCVGVKITYSYMIDKRDQNLIRIAYMNGSVDALKLDIAKIKEIKKDAALFKSLVYAAAEDYIKKVDALTERKVTLINGRGGKYTVKTGGGKEPLILAW